MSGERSQIVDLHECRLILRRFYSDSDIRSILRDLNAGSALFTSLSWERMSSLLFDGKINEATLSAYARGRRIVNRSHRRLLLIKGDDRNRIVINADDPESAAISILTARKPGGEFRASDEYIDRFIELLEVTR